ncbi:MAG TPA: hypothetical protein VEA69_00835 [Tepidisphaeraceae bacterium]|nr:hypothetical protein [Tepidisphaeraceae bacterium]
MNAIRIRRRLDSDTLHLPELQSMIGREVEIIVLDDARADAATSLDHIDPQAFWKGKSVEELAREQGVGPYEMPSSPPFTAADFEGFEEALEQWRKEK